MRITEEVIEAMAGASHRKARGRQPIYSAIAVETSLAHDLVFHQPLRQTEWFARSIADVLKIDIAIPDHTTRSRRGGALTILPKRIDRTEPLHLLVDRTGLKIYGEGEWLDQNTASAHAGAGACCILEWMPTRMNRRGGIDTGGCR